MDNPVPVRSPWHEGELALQRRYGVEARMDEVGRRVLRDHLIDQHGQFYPLLPMVVLAAVDGEGQVWPTLRAGHPGFLRAPDAHHLTVALARDPADPADAGMDDGAAIGLLGIDPTTRRRNRLNGTVHRHQGGFDVVVEQSFGNCPKYIQLRKPRFVRDPAMLSAVLPVTDSGLDAAARRLVEGADTLFVGTYADTGDRRQVDVSHRGGRAGFVRIGDDGWLTIPDFAGNRFFNTLGNIVLNPRAGLVFTDFSTGTLLQMTGVAELLPDEPTDSSIAGAERYWRFRPERVVRRDDALPLRYELTEWSPFALATGDWAR